MLIETSDNRDGGSTTIMYAETLFYIFLLQHPQSIYTTSYLVLSHFQFIALWLIYLHVNEIFPAYRCHDDAPNLGTKKLTRIIAAIILMVVLCLICG